MGECLHKAAALGATLEGANWEIFEAIGKLSDERQGAADEIRGTVVQALRSDEHVVQLGPALKEAQAKAVRLLTESTKPPGPTPQPPETKLTPKQGKRMVSQGSKENLGMAAAKDLLSGLEQELQEGRDIRVNISWIVEEGGTKQ
jgi:hypothetical protein